MNKGKRLGLIIGTVILSIILVVTFSTVAVKSTTVKKSVELGNKYIAEGNYKEAIIAFEKAINIDTKNKDVKETLDVLYIYEEIDELVIAGDLTVAQEKLEEIKDMPKFDIIKDMVENIKENIEEELLSNGMGNSIENIISGGNVAYKGDYVFYSNPKDEGKLYKMNIETGESLKIADEFATNINVYNDYVYYTDYDDYHNTPDNKAVKRLKFDGSEEEILLTESDDSFYNNMQIIDNYLYYDCNYDPLEDFPFYYSADIYKMDLDTLEKSEVITGINPTWIINKTSSGELDLYITQRYRIYGYRDINGVNEQIDIHGGLWNAEVAGINSENIYYNTLHLNDAFTYYNGYETSGMGVTKLQTESSEVFKGSELASNNYKILADDCFYVNNNGTLYSIDLSNGNESMIKKLYNSMDEYRDESLFEVKGYLAYFNENNQLTIDKDIIVKKMNNNSDETVVEEENNNKNIIIDDSEIINILNEGLNFQEQYLFSSSNINPNIKYKQDNIEYLMYIGNENNKDDILNKCKNYYSEETCNTILKLFIEVDGILYRRAGNGGWGETVISILNKETYDNTIKLLLETITEGEERQINATLKFENNKWVIDEYDALLIDKNW